MLFKSRSFGGCSQCKTRMPLFVKEGLLFSVVAMIIKEVERCVKWINHEN